MEISLGTDTVVVSVYLKDLHVGDGFYHAIGDSVLRLSGSYGIDIFIECLQMLEVCLRSYYCRSIFEICMVHLLSLWCVEMVLHDMWSWFVSLCVEMVSS